MAPVNQAARVKAFLIALAVALCVCALSYALASRAPLEYRDFIASPLLPGVALYSVAAGSLLFGSDYGALGNFALIVAGSALAWAILFAVLQFGARRWFRS